MLGLLERNITAIEERLVLVAPPQSGVPAVFDKQRIDQRRRRRLMNQLQRLRGKVYLADGALRVNDLSFDGRHEIAEDEAAWHLVMLNARGRVSACVWFREYENSVSLEQLRVRNCPLRTDPFWGELVTDAVESELTRARRDALRYAEIGGWAVSKESRCTSEGLLLALGAYSLARLLGGAIGVTTATVRHCSSTILRRLGGSQLEAHGTSVPSYYDPQYDCTMELLRFDSRRPNPRYAGLVELLKAQLSRVSVIAAPALVPAHETPALVLTSAEAGAVA